MKKQKPNHKKLDIKIDGVALRGLRYLKIVRELKTYSDAINFLLDYYLESVNEKEIIRKLRNENS